MSAPIHVGAPVRQLTEAMLSWAAQLDVLDTEVYALPGATQSRTWDPDPRLVNLAKSIDRKDSDRITYYHHVATIHHRKDGITFIAFKETRDALLARQSDPARYPLWLMESAVKATEQQTYFAVVKSKPGPMTSSIYDWRRSIEDFGAGIHCDTSWMYDVLSYVLLRKGVVKQEFYGSPA